jgi:hypothetical protein
MLIDCDTCVVRDVACDDCVVGVLLGTPTVPAAHPPDGFRGGTKRSGADAPKADRQPGGPLPLEFGPVERRALEVLADHGLIPHLRLVTPPVAGAQPAPPRRARDVG